MHHDVQIATGDFLQERTDCLRVSIYIISIISISGLLAIGWMWLGGSERRPLAAATVP